MLVRHPTHWLISTQVTDAALAPEGSNEAQRPVDISGALGMERDVRRAGGRELLDLDIYDFFATGGWTSMGASTPYARKAFTIIGPQVIFSVK